MTINLLGLGALALIAIAVCLYALFLLASNRPLHVGMSVGAAGGALWAAVMHYAYLVLFDERWAVPQAM